ncbi:hypothetical protein BN946_scf185043.g90 [Trametes cinnabarina]|uniref:Uncharacterized protein n=1 Tax=Pycnoporus cinnabarinus TaxID=5643 RepID=A0A060SHZ7_PYCCI|nr:hypothetical protein BN946_scf185043.g90 [Trametes cinnabarina]
MDLLQFYGRVKVPLDIHQGVLRNCAPSTAQIRVVAASRMREGGRYKDSLLYEARYRDVIRNIRASGDIPALEDYHCVLDFFAAIGNYRHALLILDEIAELGLQKNAETYQLCLHALAHGLTQPIWHLNRPKLVDEITEHCKKLLAEMSQSNIPYTRRIVDLAFRILKETLNMEGFTTLLKGAYGIDLAYPDRSPLQFWDEGNASQPTEDATATHPASFPQRLPFSLTALNTALDYLGRAGEVSKMVQLFEIATNPLPSSASNQSIDDDDDDDFGLSNPQVAPYNPPHVKPNTTTFHVLLRSLHLADHAVLARHYLLVAREMERDQGRQLEGLIKEGLIKNKPSDELPSPRVSMTRSLLLPVFSIANDNKNVELMRWIVHKTRQTVRRKHFSIRFYQQVRARWVEEGVYRPSLSEPELEEIDDLPLGPSSSRFSTFFDPSSSPRSASAQDIPIAHPTESKPFHIDLHLALLRRDLDQLVEFQAHIEDALARTVQRVKERLGRRVWGDKNVFLRDARNRQVVSKEFWRARVNYHPKVEPVARPNTRLQRPPENPSRTPSTVAPAEPTFHEAVVESPSQYLHAHPPVGVPGQTTGSS